MKKVLLVAFVLLLAASCKQANMEPGGPELSVSFRFEKGHRCASVSPELRIANVPPGTKSFDIRLKDRDVPTWNHGGGKVPNDGSGVIGEGALSSYNGPCPPSGSHVYEFTVQALDAGGAVLATGRAKQSF
ncbi:hypothetical protein NNJEOMEG_00758 [Fundidesulfovibrio magnetotacticus]|uniref:Phospholipid-binding protein n=1 Tax=Fundidesulfovibrio magnetotacticus TaxID=2730080 RepID=A0A6V8LPL3_9BACT|nr:MbtF [Fundidesulfovibrio magnetotacticus]GFK92930.1 hypothetical protein NNJEOMEG_00758 [Fundidesulfovibrio magnetotacticus]